MFVIQPKPTFKIKVEIPTPTGPGVINIEFAHKGRKALAKFLEGASEEGANVQDIDALSEIVVGWDGVDQAFSKKALEDLLDAYPAAGKALFDAYLPALIEGRVKN
jgi:hypothetical protein